MKNSDLIKANETTLAELLREGCFHVPRHQRSYDWDEEHVDTLLKDLADAVNSDSSCHFLGAIMLIKREKGGGWEINDGQQRIITFSLICAYLCKFFMEQKQSAGEDHALRILFQLGEVHGKRLQDAHDLDPRIFPPQNDEANFKLLICGENVSANGKMTTAAKKISGFFEDATRQSLAWRTKLLHFMLNDVIVIRLEIAQSLDANAIFETLNYRGRPVDQVDLIKNYFLQSFRGESDAKAETLYKNLDHAYKSFSGKGKAGGIAEYVRCAMQIEAGFINKEQFLRATKNFFSKKGSKKTDEIFDFVGKLATGARIQAFQTFLRPATNEETLDKLTKHARQSGANRNIHDYLADLKQYSIARPVIFALLLSYLSAPEKQKREVAKTVYMCAKNLASFTQRSAHMENFSPALFEESFANLAMKISKKQCTSASAFFAELKNCDHHQITTDGHYIAKMRAISSFRRSKSGKPNSKLVYILKRVVEHERHGARVSDNEVTIEHVLPQSERHSSKPGWSAAFTTPNERAHYVNTLGNLVLLGKGEDSSADADNESYAAKKALYAKSTYKMARELHKTYKKWTPETIKNRQGAMVKIAAKQIWNFQF